MQHAISELLQSNRIVRSITTSHVVNPLSVSVQSFGTLRLILDLRHVNNYIQKQNSKYEDWKTALTYFHKGCYMIYFDLKSGYHHIRIHKHSWGLPGSDQEIKHSHITSSLFYRLMYAAHLSYLQSA